MFIDTKDANSSVDAKRQIIVNLVGRQTSVRVGDGLVTTLVSRRIC